MNNIVQKAILTAMKAHEGQVRKGDGKTPYVLHPLEVGITLSHYTTVPALIAIAIMHDVVEDSKITVQELKQEFGSEISTGVELMTENKSIEKWVERKTENLQRLAGNKTIYVIKAIDTLVNMRELFAALEEQGETVWEKFNAPKEHKMIYFEQILDETKSDLPADLLEKYVSALKDLQYAHLLPHQKQEIGFKS